MKHQLNEVVGEEPENHSVKKIRDEEPCWTRTENRGLKRMRAVEPPFPFWNRLPNEVKAMIVGKMDVKTSASFKECGRTERELVRNHTKYLVSITLVFLDGKMNIKLSNQRSKLLQLEWWIHENPSGGAKVEYSISYRNFEPRVVILHSKTVATATSLILRKLLTEPTFEVYGMQLKLANYNQKIDLDSISANIHILILWGCQKLQPVFSIIQNKNINFKEHVGALYDDRRLLYEIDSLNHGKPQTLHASSTFPMNRDGSYCLFLFSLRQSSYKDGYWQLKNFWDLTLGLYRFVNMDNVNINLKLRKTIDDIMLFRAAYYHNPTVPYIRNHDANLDVQFVEPFADRYSFLRDGIDEILSDYQLSILSIAYLVRLFRDEPEIEKLYDIAFEDLRLVLKKQEDVNLYEKLVAKLEALLP